MSFVMLAGARRASGSREYTTSPVAPFATTTARASTTGKTSCADAAGARTRARRRGPSSRRTPANRSRLQSASVGAIDRRERALEVQLGALGGIEVRPTRIFLWGGAEREGHERLVSLGPAPKNLVDEGMDRELRAGSVRVRSLGNPLLTVALAGVHAARKVRAARSTSGSGSAGRE
jgi:hypothetical protein